MFRLFRSLEETDGFAPSAVSIGNFDGVHRGHRRIFERVAGMARDRGLKPSVLTFDPHPTRVVAPERSPRLLSTIDERAAWMRECGIVQVLVLPFTRDIAGLSAEEFVRRILVEKLGARAVLIGHNFRFGRGAAGDAALLERLGAKHGFHVESVEAVRVRGHVVSSSAIRELIGCGRVERAARLLGRWYALEGVVVSGHGVGSKQTVPTLNLSTSAEVLPARGVYVTRTRDLVSGRAWPSVSNIGFRPTFGGDRLSIETFLLDPLEGGAPARIRVEFCFRLREERKFDSPESLKEQIVRDAGRARRWHARYQRWVRD